jgi:sugar/nucleoside kinase (ribokinase family)
MGTARGGGGLSAARDGTYDVLLQGRAFCDLTFAFKERDRLPELGQEVFADDFEVGAGGIFNIVAVLSGLGIRVGWRTQLGNDLFSGFIAQQMEECGLSFELAVREDYPLPIVTAGVSFPHDRMFLSYAAPLPEDVPEATLTPDDLDRLMPKVLFTYGEVGIQLMRAARDRGILVYVDTYWNSEHLESLRLRTILDNADIVAPNLSEALRMTGAKTAESALQMLSDLCPRGAIKRGAEGCLAWDRCDRFAIPAIPVVARETTGAGDSFNAGLIFGLLQGYPFDRCLRCANIVGGLSTLALGGCRSGVRAAVVQDWLERLESGAPA